MVIWWHGGALGRASDLRFIGSRFDFCLGTIIIIINKVLIKVTINKVIAGTLYIVICG